MEIQRATPSRTASAIRPTTATTTTVPKCCAMASVTVVSWDHGSPCMYDVHVVLARLECGRYILAEVSQGISAMTKAPRTKQQAIDTFKAKKESYSHAVQNQLNRSTTRAVAAEAIEQITQAGETGLRRMADFKRHRTEPIQPHPDGHRAIFGISSIIEKARAELRQVQELVAEAHGVPLRPPSNRPRPKRGIRRPRDHDDDDAPDPRPP
jgi:hypothetical protein